MRQVSTDTTAFATRADLTRHEVLADYGIDYNLAAYAVQVAKIPDEEWRELAPVNGR